MGIRDTVDALFGGGWHVNSKAILDAMWPATDGTSEANKPLVTDANNAIDGVTIAEIVRVADVSARIVSLATASPTLSVASHEGKTLVLNRATGVAVTLPAATGSGSIFKFVVGTSFSGGSFVATTSASGLLKGLALGLDGDGVPANAWAAGASDEVFTMDGSTQGGVVGDEVVFQDIATNVWAVQARLQQSGTEASPFSSAA